MSVDRVLNFLTGCNSKPRVPFRHTAEYEQEVIEFRSDLLKMYMYRGICVALGAAIGYQACRTCTPPEQAGAVLVGLFAGLTVGEAPVLGLTLAGYVAAERILNRT
jgi:hypothetical protein